MSDWKETTLDRLGRIVTGKTPPTGDPENYNGHIMFVTPTDMNGRRIIDRTLRHVTDQGLKSVYSSRVPARSILVSCIGSDLGKAVIAGNDCVTNQQINSLIVSDDYEYMFVYYNLSARKNEIKNAAGGAAQPILNKTDFGRLPILMPSRNYQKAIASVLSVLDDKIELNRRMNDTLEAMARAIYRDWFVDFGPTYAKIECRTPYLATEIWSLFPNEFNSNGNPVDWKSCEIRSLTTSIQYGLTQSAKVSGPGPQFLRITDIQGGRVDWTSVPYCDVSVEDEEKYCLLTGDIVVARTGASTGENAYIIEPPRSVFASYLVRFQFSSNSIARVVAQFMRSEEYRSFIAGSIGGSAQPNASAQVLASASSIFPPSQIANAFFDLVSPMDTLKRNNEREIETLSQLIAVLLPKLMSGELRVNDAEKVVEAAL